jgi:hypothetical protein
MRRRTTSRTVATTTATSLWTRTGWCRLMWRGSSSATYTMRFSAPPDCQPTVQNSRRLGREMAEHLRQAGVEAVILTST